MASYDDLEGVGSDKVRWARNRLAEHSRATGVWKTEASEAYACVAGRQWDESDVSDMEQNERAVFTFNRVAGFIRGICGLETSSRNEVRYYGREQGDDGLDDVINAVAKWVREGCDAEDEESDAFKDMLICGIGWTETYFTTEEDAEGQIVVERVDPLHMRWDPAARKRGLADRRWCARVKWLPIATIRDVWGKAKADEVQTLTESDSELLEEEMGKPHDATAAREYESDTNGNARRRTGYPVVQFQYVETAHFVRVQNPMSGMIEELPKDAYDKLVKRTGMELGGEEVKHRQYRQLIYCGHTELEDAVLPCNGFTFQPITGIRDRNEGVWYGFIRDLLDPQRWINKFFSSMADVVASQAKGGLLAESDAFANKQRAEEDWADPRSIVWMNPGGMEKIKERTSAGIPAGFSQLLQFTVESLPHVAGINLEFLGMAAREQPGVLEHQRKQAAISTLAEFFNAMRLYRKQQGRILLKFIDTYLTDGRLVRIVGKDQAQYVPLMRLPDAFKYDVVVDEAPNSPDQKARTWDALTQILPVMGKMGMAIPPQVVEYAPFPKSLIEDWKEFGETQGMSPEIKEQMQQMQEELGALKEENQKLQSKKEEAMAMLQIKQQESQQSMAMEYQKHQMQMQIEQEKMQLERQKLAMELEKLQMSMQIEQTKAQASVQLQREAGEQKMQISEQQAGHQMEMSERQAEHQETMAKQAAKQKPKGKDQ